MSKPEKLDALTGLRFVAASMIVLHHLQGLLWIPKGAFGIFNLGNGVSFFFVLSGFILHYNYRDTMRDVPYPSFVLLRFFRLWPAHLAALLFVVVINPGVIAWLSAQLSGIEILRVVLLMHSLTPDMRLYYAWNGPSWSIATELWFYAAFPLLTLWCARRPAATLLVIAAGVAAYLALAQNVLYDPAIKGNAHGLGSISPVPRLLEFTAGIVACELVIFRGMLREAIRRHGAALQVAAIVLVVAGLWLSAQLRPTFRTHLGEVPMDYLRAAFIFPAFMVLIAVFSQGAGFPASFLSRRWVVWLGDVSFSIYLTHQPLIGLFRRTPALMALPDPVQILLYAAAVLGVSAFIFHLVERPGVRLSRRLIGARDRRPKSQDAASSRTP